MGRAKIVQRNSKRWGAPGEGGIGRRGGRLKREGIWGHVYAYG